MPVFLLLFVLPFVLFLLFIVAIWRKWISLRIALCAAAGVLATFVNIWLLAGLAGATIACGDSLRGCKPDPAWAEQGAILALPMSLIPNEFIAQGPITWLFNAALWGFTVFFILLVLTLRSSGTAQKRCSPLASR